MSYNPAVLQDALKARSLTMRDLSKRLEMDLSKLEAEVALEDPGMTVIGRVAKELSLPKFAFFMSKSPPMDGELCDFRSDNPSVTKKSRQTVEAIQFAEGVQRAAIELSDKGARQLPKFSATENDAIESFALVARKFFGLTVEDQKGARDAKAFYTICRKKIEEAGIYVLHATFPAEDGSGFCLYHDDHPVIVVNTKQQTRGRRLFTLIHELAHILMGKSGISDPFVNKNAVERRCNRFAGAFLVPSAWVKSLLKGFKVLLEPDADDVAAISRRFKTSQEASVLRLEQLGLVNAGTHRKWLALVRSRGNPDFSEKGGGGNGQPPPQEKTKLAKYGFRFAQVFSDILDHRAISPLNLYRSSGLKPTYQRAYFDYAKSLTDDQLQDLELFDE